MSTKKKQLKLEQLTQVRGGAGNVSGPTAPAPTTPIIIVRPPKFLDW